MRVETIFKALKLSYLQVHITHKNYLSKILFLKIVVTQYYEADSSKEHVIRGNAGIIKCVLPSFIADFLDVVSWHTDQDENFFPGTDYGL